MWHDYVKHWKNTDTRRLVVMCLCLVAGQPGAECEVVPDVAMAGKEALVQINDGARPAVHRFMVREWLTRESVTCVGMIMSRPSGLGNSFT